MTLICLLLLPLQALGDADRRAPVLCTTFPVFQIARNVVQGRDALRVDCMLPSSLGCPHDYVCTPQDMKRLSEARALVVNGLGLDDGFTDGLDRGRTPVIVSCEGIEGILASDETDHGRPGANPHLFASPRMAGLMASNIARGLARIDPEGEALYVRNAQDYAARLGLLSDEFVAVGKTLSNNRIVTQHEIFDYLARDMGLEIVAVIQAHAGQEPSASEMMRISKAIRERKVGAIFVEPQYSDRVGQTLARETGVPLAVLDPVASGPEGCALDYYEMTMRSNLETLKKTLGVRK